MEPLELSVARILHTAYCGCGGPMSEPPFTTGWTEPARQILKEIGKRFEQGKAKGTNLHHDNEGRTLLVTDKHTQEILLRQTDKA